MTILFAPSESKNSGGEKVGFGKADFLFPQLWSKREEVLKRYDALLKDASIEELSHLFGIKDVTKIERTPLHEKPTMKAILRYTGVAYEYLHYPTLTPQAQAYIDTHTMIFSNLFGPILAGDEALPEYKLKQGQTLDGFAPQKHYRTHFSSALDAFLEEQTLLDLRAGFYDAFYQPKIPYVTVKFLKNGKVVSHWAKAYRGMVLRACALHDISDPYELQTLPIQGLVFDKAHTQGLATQLIFSILN